MYYSLTKSQELELLSKPETGMGYQVIEARDAFKYSTERYIVLNSQIVVELNGYEGSNIALVIKEGISRIKAKADLKYFSSVKVLNEMQFRSIVSEPQNAPEKGATNNNHEYATGSEMFVRLSAFEDDFRIDREKKCLRSGSYTTTIGDYTVCKTSKDNPIERYALPNDEKIEWAFYIQPKNIDILQRGTVQPANGKRGGGKEVYFENGTSSGTFVKHTPY